MIKKIIFLTIIILVAAFFGLKLVGFFDNNQIKLTIGTDDKDELNVGVATEKVDKENIVEKLVEDVDEKTGCIDNNQCEGKKCIDGECQEVADLYETKECQAKCNFNKATLLTSSGRTISISRGQSTYTEAGAIAYKLLSGPDYCENSDPVVPIEITKMNLGKELGKEVITIEVGETSPVITHPTIKRIKFTLEVKGITQIC